MINSLTAEQQADLVEFRERYMQIAVGGNRIDRAELESALADAYKAIDRSPPKLLVFDSPAACMLAIHKMEGGKFDHEFMPQTEKVKLGGHLRDQMGGGHGTLLDRLGDAATKKVHADLDKMIKAELRDVIHSATWEWCRSQVKNSLSSMFGDKKSGDVPVFIDSPCWGSLDGSWVCYALFLEHIGVRFPKEASKNLHIMDRIGQQCEFWWPFENYVVASQKPLHVYFDDNGRLHRENDLAIRYADNYGIACWRGTQIPNEWVSGKLPSPQEALRWPNMERRRCAMELIGWATILRELKAKTIDVDPDPQIGTLVEVELPEIGRERFLKVLCSTGREFALSVPPEMKTALEANSWSWDLPPEAYRPEVQT